MYYNTLLLHIRIQKGAGYCLFCLSFWSQAFALPSIRGIDNAVNPRQYVCDENAPHRGGGHALQDVPQRNASLSSAVGWMGSCEVRDHRADVRKRLYRIVCRTQPTSGQTLQQRCESTNLSSFDKTFSYDSILSVGIFCKTIVYERYRQGFRMAKTWHTV